MMSMACCRESSRRFEMQEWAHPIAAPCPLQGIPFDGCGGVLSGDKRVSFIPELNALAGLFADFGELGCGNTKAQRCSAWRKRLTWILPVAP
jgi:hypothetical protein